MSHFNKSKKQFIKTCSQSSIFDILIIGAGVGGLELGFTKANDFKKEKCGANIAIIDQSDYVGGRVRSVNDTFQGKKISYEAGAARFNNNHKSLLSVINRCGLKNKMIKIPSFWEFRPTDNYKTKWDKIPFENVEELLSELVKYYNKPKHRSYLRNKTLYEACRDLYGYSIAEYLKNSYSYYSEIKVFNGLNAIRSLTNDLSEQNQFYILGGGLAQVPQCQAKQFLDVSNNNPKINTFISLKTQAHGWKYDEKTKLFEITILDLESETKYKVYTKNLVFAVDGKSLSRWKNQLKTIQPKIIDIMKHVTSQPLLRTYAIYKSKWFAKYGKVVTDGLVKYVIPIDPKIGLIMISYTDGEYVRKMMRHINDGTQEEAIYKSLKEIFPEDTIEKKPAYLRNEYWDCGAVYWNKGADSDKMSKFMMKPSKNHNLFICGDSFSENQAWTDGAIYNAREVAKKI